METTVGKYTPYCFMRMKIELSFMMRFNTALNKGESFLGVNAVDLIRPMPSVTNMISYHSYICAN